MASVKRFGQRALAASGVVKGTRLGKSRNLSKFLLVSLGTGRDVGSAEIAKKVKLVTYSLLQPERRGP